MVPEINSYIEKRYDRWLDYSKFHSDQAGIPDEAIDILNEVMVSLLDKEDEDVLNLLNKKKGQYTELDFFVLRMIKLNCCSVTSGYYSKYKPKSKLFDPSVDVSRLKVIDEEDESIDIPALVLKEFRLFRYVANGLDLTKQERKIFEFRFFHEDSFLSWPGPENFKQAYAIYSTIIRAIHEILFYQGLTRIKPKQNTTYIHKSRKKELVEDFLRKHRVYKQKKLSLTMV